MKEIDKRYIFERENGNCFHCGKPLRYHKMTLDHYYPKSKGGTLELYNLVACCKSCNKLKQSRIPFDWDKVNIELFKDAVEKKRITYQGMSQDKLIELAMSLNQVYRNKLNTVFEAPGVRLYVKENRIVKTVYFAVEADD